MIQKIRSFAPTSREKGFSLMEMLIVVLILGILATVAVFLYLGAQKNADEAAVKTGLLQASALIEQEKDDLNGMYPKYLPNEVVQNELWSKFAYTYSDDRLVYCLQARQPDPNDPTNLDKDTKWYISSTDKTVNNTTPCTQNNQGTNSVPPWGVIIPPLAKPTAFTMSWPIGATSAKADITWPSLTCSSGAAISYEIELYDKDEKVTFNDKPVTGTNITYSKLNGFLPGDNVQVRIKTYCTVNFNNRDNVTTSDFTAPVTADPIPDLPVPNTDFINKPAAFLCKGTEAYDDSNKCSNNAVAATQFTMYATSQLASVTCPVGVNKYQVTAKQGSGVPMASTLATSQTQNWQLTNFTADTSTDYTGYAFCEVTRAAGSTVSKIDYPSAAATYNEYSPVGWPAAATGLTTTSAYSGTGTTPNGLVWNAAACTFGGTPQYRYVQTAPGSITSGFQTGTGAGPISWNQATTYTYYVADKCVTNHNNSGTVVQSKVVPGNAYQFTTDVDVPAPTYATVPAAYHPSATTMSVKGQLNTITCYNGSIPYYSITATQNGKSSVSSTPSTSPNFNLDISSFAADTDTQYYGFNYCYVLQGNGTYKPYVSTPIFTREYTPISAPTAATTATGISGDPDVIYNQLNASTATCPYGGSIRYRFTMTAPSNGTTAWSTGASTTGTFSGNNVDLGNLSQGTNYAVAAQTYCAGTNVNSPTTTGSSISFTAIYNTPHAPSRPTNVSVSTTDPTQTQYVSWNSVSCDRGGQAQYRMVQSGRNGQDIGDSYMNTGWTTATSWNTSGWIDYQGAYYKYSVKARCVNNFTSAESSWTDTNWFIEGIRTPDPVQNLGNNAFYNVGWSGVYCPSGTYPTYYVVQDEKDWNYYWTELANRTTSTGVGNVGGGVSGQQRVFVQAYCNSSTINNYASNGSGYSYTQWRTYGAPSINQNSIGGCGWADVYTYAVCNTSYNAGYPGPNNSGYNGDVGGLNYNTSGQLYGTPSSPGYYALYGTLYSDAGASNGGNRTWLGNVYIPEYNMNAHNASDNWYNYGGSQFQPCTNYAYNNPGPNCSSVGSGWNHGRGNTIKYVVSAGNGTRGAMRFDTKGLVNQIRYRISCDVASTAGSVGFSQFAMYVENGPGAVTRANPNAQTWYNLTYDWTYTGNQSRVVLLGDNKTGSDREMAISNCSINQI